ncbi:MAG: hypothetical protein J5862_03545, partial [Bacteroidales bacterium]|nr:hypothetical protein [Bacteroidales bacterium]
MKINHGDRNKEISGTLVDLIDLTASATNLGGYFTLGAKGLVNPLLSRLYNPIKNNVRTTYNVGKSLYNAAKQTAKKTTTSLAKPNVVSEIGVPLQKINLDKLYFDAIEKGDIAEAQRLRDLHFISKARNPITEYNKPTHLYHGTRSEPFYIFDNSKGFQSVGSWLTKEPSKAIFTVPSYSEAKLYTGKHGHVIDLYGNSKPEIIDWGGNDWTIGDFGTSTETANVYLNHYPSLKYKNIRDASNIAVDEYIFNQNNNDLKLADPITYDNAGNIIPLSKRDNFKVNDIRYGWFGKQPNGTFVEDYTDFNTMVQRMNNKVQYDGVNPFTDGKMTGFRKWALNNGASPKK